MFTRNSITKGSLIFALFISTLVHPLPANQNTFSATTKGFEIKHMQNTGMNFIHAELIIYYRDKNVNPAIRHLTLLNLFDEDVNRSGSSLLNILKKLGNDYEITHRPDYLLFEINFLEDKLSTFMQFLKSLYSQKPFSLKEFKYSVDNYWNLFLKKEDWKKAAAFQVAYQKLFPGHPLGNSLIVPRLLKNINLAQIRSYYLKTYTLTNSTLILKGNIKDGMAVGTFYRQFKSFKNQERKKTIDNDRLNINDGREIIIYHIDSNSLPEIFWFEAIPKLTDKNHMPARVLNDMLFGQPIGRISRAKINNGIRYLKIDTDVINHTQVSVICNAIRLNFADIEKFILSVDIEKRKLKKINRREYLDAKNYFCGQLKVNTRKFENQVELERDFSFLNPLGNNQAASFIQASQQVTYESLSTAIPSLSAGTIVIVGNASLIARYLTVLKHRVIQYIR